MKYFALLLLLILIGCHSTAETPITQRGTVKNVEAAFTANGDGSLWLNVARDKYRYRVKIYIIGTDNQRPATVINLKTVSYIQDLWGQEVEVTGYQIEDRHHYYLPSIIATRIDEL